MSSIDSTSINIAFFYFSFLVVVLHISFIRCCFFFILSCCDSPLDFFTGVRVCVCDRISFLNFEICSCRQLIMAKFNAILFFYMWKRAWYFFECVGSNSWAVRDLGSLPLDHCLEFFFLTCCENIRWPIVLHSEGRRFPYIYKLIRWLVYSSVQLVSSNQLVGLFGASIPFNMKTFIILSCLVLAYAKPQGYQYNQPAVKSSFVGSSSNVSPSLSLTVPSFGKNN